MRRIIEQVVCLQKIVDDTVDTIIRVGWINIWRRNWCLLRVFGEKQRGLMSGQSADSVLDSLAVG